VTALSPSAALCSRHFATVTNLAPNVGAGELVNAGEHANSGFIGGAAFAGTVKQAAVSIKARTTDM
jgi:hypothetical protein